jgi:toxin FitB
VIVLDTNVVSAFMKPTPTPTVVAWLDGEASRTLFISTVTIAEIGFGIRSLPVGRRRQDLSEKFEAFLQRAFSGRILDFNLEAAHHFADLMSHRRSIGRPMSPLDGQIAAIARAHGFAVATGNVRDSQACGIEVINPFHHGL